MLSEMNPDFAYVLPAQLALIMGGALQKNTTDAWEDLTTDSGASEGDLLKRHMLTSDSVRSRASRGRQSCQHAQPLQSSEVGRHIL